MAAQNNKLRDEFKVLLLVWRNAKGQHLKLSAAMLLELVLGFYPPVLIYLLQGAVGLRAANLEALLTRANILLVLVVYFVYLLLSKLSSILMAYAVTEVEYSLRSKFLLSLRRMPYADLAGRINMQSSNGLTQEIAMASALVPMVYRAFIRATATIVAFCVLLLIVSPRFFGIVLALTGAVVLSVVVLRSQLKRIHQELYNRISSLYQLFAEWVGGNRVFRVFGSMDFAVARMQRTFLSIRTTSRRLALLSNGQAVLAEMLTYSVAAVIIVLMPTNAGVVDLGVLISFPAAILFIRKEAMVLIGGYQQLANTESSIKRLFSIIQTPTAEDADEQKPVGSVRRIVLDGVSYAYPTDTAPHEILRHATLQLERGRLHVLTGPSGTGKTTTLNLLLGLLHPQAGSIRFEEGDGEHRGMALVEQEPFFFDGTLYDNLCLGRPNIRPADIMPHLQALHLTHLYPTEESRQESTQMMSRKLSTGEKQRLALVRALIGKPSVLIVDEVTSNIDTATSLLIADYLQQLSREVLVVAVSHDPILMERAEALHILNDKTFN